MPQVQCPNCGGYRVNSYAEEHVDPRTGRAVEPRGCSGCIYSLGVSIVMFGLLLPAAIVDSVVWGKAILIYAVLGLWAIAVGVLILTELMKPLAENLVPHWGHSCVLCGYAWSEGQPHSPTTVRPDLIQRGAQRIEEERDAWDDID